MLFVMPDPAPPPLPPSSALPPKEWPPDLVFTMLIDPVRRHLLETFARGVSAPASQLAPAAGRRLDALLKHLTAMRTAGLVVAKHDPQDHRRQLYSLSPDVTVRTVPDGREIDFGCCVLRVRDH